jgi:23S rRNA A2030 N6-methylase RlmJ
MNPYWGNAGDIVKHCLLVAWLDFLQPGMLQAYVETHAGAPLYGPEGPVPFREAEHPHVVDLLDLYRTEALPPALTSLSWFKELDLLNGALDQSTPYYLGSPAWAVAHFPGVGSENTRGARMYFMESDPESVSLLEAWAQDQNSPPTITVHNGDGPSLVNRIVPIKTFEQERTTIFIDPFAWTDELDKDARSWLDKGAIVIGWYPIFDSSRTTFIPCANLEYKSGYSQLSRIEVVWDIDAKSPLVGAGMFFAPCNKVLASTLAELGKQLETSLRMALKKAQCH